MVSLSSLYYYIMTYRVTMVTYRVTMVTYRVTMVTYRVTMVTTKDFYHLYLGQWENSWENFGKILHFSQIFPMIFPSAVELGGCTANNLIRSGIRLGARNISSFLTGGFAWIRQGGWWEWADPSLLIPLFSKQCVHFQLK